MSKIFLVLLLGIYCVAGQLLTTNPSLISAVGSLTQSILLILESLIKVLPGSPTPPLPTVPTLSRQARSIPLAPKALSSNPLAGMMELLSGISQIQKSAGCNTNIATTSCQLTPTPAGFKLDIKKQLPKGDLDLNLLMPVIGKKKVNAKVTNVKPSGNLLDLQLGGATASFSGSGCSFSGGDISGTCSVSQDGSFDLDLLVETIQEVVSIVSDLLDTLGLNLGGVLSGLGL